MESFAHTLHKVHHSTYNYLFPKQKLLVFRMTLGSLKFKACMFFFFEWHCPVHIPNIARWKDCLVWEFTGRGKDRNRLCEFYSLQKIWWFLPVEKISQTANTYIYFSQAKIVFEQVGISASVKQAKLCSRHNEKKHPYIGSFYHLGNFEGNYQRDEDNHLRLSSVHVFSNKTVTLRLCSQFFAQLSAFVCHFYYIRLEIQTQRQLINSLKLEIR